ncbi:MAG: hypothetical protein ABFS19_07715 [Thermodesulfobacteriota bacterium]
MTDKQTKTVSDETVLKVSKEIVVKFIEVGRVTPDTFEKVFQTVHSAVRRGITESHNKNR